MAQEMEMEKIELHHPSIEEIMGAPPARSIALGSGIILTVLFFLLIGSMFIDLPDIIRVNTTIYGQVPIAVLTAPETGRIIFQKEISTGQIVRKEEIFFHIEKSTTGQYIPVVVPATGILEINPLVRIRENVFQNDTIGYIRNEKSVPVVCVLQLPDIIAKKVQSKQNVRVFIDTNEPENFIETKIKEKIKWTVTNQTQFIAVLPEQQLGEKGLYGTIHGYAEITIGVKSLFQQLINPFRGLHK